MKKGLSIITMIAFVAFFAACNGEPKGENADAKDAKDVKEAGANAIEYAVNPENTKVNWEGNKPTGQHVGYVNVTEGSVSVNDGKLVAGKFVMDMNSIYSTDLEGSDDMKAKLEGHLKSDEFFDVENHPTSVFEITKVTEYQGETIEGFEPTHSITGNLTMRGTAKSITFPAKVSISDEAVSATTPQFMVDRTQWGVNHMSKTIFAEIKDKFIDDLMGLSIVLEAKK